MKKLKKIYEYDPMWQVPYGISLVFFAMIPQAVLIGSANSDIQAIALLVIMWLPTLIGLVYLSHMVEKYIDKYIDRINKRNGYKTED